MAKASDKAYATIRGMILSGELASGDQLVEEALAERCGVSRTPVRDALRRLEAELLVRRSESQRSFVNDWSLDDLADSFELRAMLEGLAARRAAERMTPEALNRLRSCNGRLGAAIRAKSPAVNAFVDENRAFHSIILNVAGSPRLNSLLASLIEQPVVHRTARQYGTDAFNRSYHEHEDLLAAFARRDGDWAEAVMRGHIRRAFHAYADAHRGLSVLEKNVA